MPNSKSIDARDRYVAFAIASADVFIELDQSGTITFASGATKWLRECDQGGYVGEQINVHIAPRDKALLETMLDQVQTKGRIANIRMDMISTKGNTRSVDLSCSFLPDWPHARFITIKAAKTYTNNTPLRPDEIDAESGLANAKSFEDFASKIMANGDANAKMEMSFLTLDALDENSESYDESITQELLGDVSAVLRTISGHQRGAARVAPNKFGIMHDKAFSGADLKAMLEKRLPSHIPFGVQTALVNKGDMSESDISKALVYTINRFAQDDSFTFSTLGESYQAMVTDTKQRLKNFKDVIENKRFDIVLQPIVDIQTCEVHHYEILSRLHDGTASPFDFITFAEEIGVIGDFDMAVLDRSIERMIKMVQQGAKDVSLAVNVSGRSLLSFEFMNQFMKRMDWLKDYRSNMMFEITESAQIGDLASANKAIQSIRALGHKVCLDDFGAGSSGFQYLRQLEVDYIKIDGSYIKDSLTNPTGKALLRSVADLCRQLNIKTIGEWVETEQQRKLLKEIGVNLGQGHLFGKPSTSTTGKIAYAGMANQVKSTATQKKTA